MHPELWIPRDLMDIIDWIFGNIFKIGIAFLILLAVVKTVKFLWFL